MGAIRLTKHDFDTVRSLAGMAGIAPERVTALQRRWQIEPHRRLGAPYVLAFGSQEAIRQIVSAVAGADAAQKVVSSSASVVIVGHDPDSVKPLASIWPHIKADQAPVRALLVLRSTDRISAATLEALASLGTIDRAILATRLTQPLNQDERHLAQALTGVAETVQVVLTGSPAEDISRDEAVELVAYASVQAEGTGFKGARYFGASFWLCAADRGLPGELQDISALFTVDETQIGRHREAVLMTALQLLIEDIDSNIEAQPPQLALPVTPEDIERLIAQFNGHLQGLGKDIGRLAVDGDLRSGEEARTYAADRISNWVNGQTLQSATLNLAEKFKPGLKARLLFALAEATRAIDIEAKAAKLKQGAELTAAFGFLAKRAWARAIVAIGLGILAAFAAQVLTLLFPLEADAFVTRLATLAVGALCGVIIYFILLKPWVIGRGEEPKAPYLPEISPLKGWPFAQERLLAAFSAHMRDEGAEAARKSLAELKHRLTDGSST